MNSIKKAVAQKLSVKARGTAEKGRQLVVIGGVVITTLKTTKRTSIVPGKNICFFGLKWS